MPADTLDEADTLRQQNPLGKMPCLLLEDGTALYDSRVIIEFLQDEAGTDRLVPKSGLARYKALTRAALADGITDAALLMVYEGRFRDPGTLFGALAGASARQDHARRWPHSSARRPIRPPPTSWPSGCPARSAISTGASRSNGARTIRVLARLARRLSPRPSRRSTHPRAGG